MELFSIFGRILLKDDGIENKLKSVTGQAENTGNKFTSAFSKVGSTLLKVGGIIGAGLGFKAMFSAAEKAEQRLAQMDTVLKSTGGAAGMSKQELLKLADAQGKLTTFSKGANIETENLLLTFTNIGKKAFPDALKSVNDMSQALGQDTKSSAIQLGKALNDPIKGITALSRVGVSFTSQQKEQIAAMVKAGDVAGAQGIILKELQKEFGGSAEAAGKTFGGQLTILKNQILGVGASALSSLLPTLSSLISKINSNMPQIQKVVTTVFKAFGDSVKFVVDNINWLIPVIAGLAGGFVALKIIGIVNGLMAAYTAFTTTATGVQIGLNAALAANPIGLIIAAIAALIAIGVALVMNWDKVKVAAGKLFGGIKDTFSKVGSFVSNTWNTMKQNTIKAWDGIKNKVAENGGGIKGILKTGVQIYTGIWKAGLNALNKITGGKFGEILRFFSTLPGKFKSLMNGVGNAIVHGFDSALDFIKNLPSKMLEWGKDMIDGLVQGIKSMIGKVGDAVSGVAKKIRSFLHFSKPDEGPLSDADTYGADFMQLLADTIDKNSDKPAESAKRVAQLVSDRIKNVKDTLKTNLDSLNKELSNLSNQEEVALRGVKGSKRYAIQDEYNQKKQAIKDEIQLRKDQADKEIAEIRRIGSMSKDELQKELDDRKSFIDSINSLNEQIKNALKAKYEEDEKNQEDSLSKELESLDNWKDQAEKMIDSVYSKKIQDIEDAATAQEKALQAEINALDSQKAAEDRADKHKEYENKISDLKGQIKYSHDDYNKAELQKQLVSTQAEYQKELNSEAVSDKKESLQRQIDVIKDNAEKQKQLLEKEKQAELNNITSIYNTQKSILNQQLSDLKTFYSKKLEDVNLEAESEKLIMQNNQNEIVALLNSYGEQYKAAGQTLGERLAEGFKPAIDSMTAMVASITSQISAARDNTISAMQSANTVVGTSNIPSTNTSKTVSNNSNTTVTNNFSFTHNSPTKASPADERKQDESFFRKAAFQLA